MVERPKIGRPPHPDPLSRTFTFKLTPSQEAAIEKAAKAAGLSPRVWVRERALAGLGVVRKGSRRAD